MTVIHLQSASVSAAGCVAEGYTPHQIDIVIINDTEYDLELDKNECSSECGCTGFHVSAYIYIELISIFKEVNLTNVTR